MYDLEETLTDSMINTKERGGRGVVRAGGMLGRSFALTLNFLLLLEAGTLHCIVHISNCLRRRTDDQKRGRPSICRAQGNKTGVWGKAHDFKTAKRPIIPQALIPSPRQEKAFFLHFSNSAIFWSCSRRRPPTSVRWRVGG